MYSDIYWNDVGPRLTRMCVQVHKTVRGRKILENMFVKSCRELYQVTVIVAKHNLKPMWMLWTVKQRKFSYHINYKELYLAAWTYRHTNMFKNLAFSLRL